MRKLLVATITAMMACCCALGGCAEPPENSEGGGTLPPPEGGIVKSVSEVGAITGRHSPWNDTITGAAVAGTDLGIPVYDSVNDRMLIFFGDTYSTQVEGAGSGKNDWRSNVCAWSKDADLSDGLTLDGWICNKNREIAKQIVPSLKTDGYEITTIPTGAIEVNGSVYLFYMSVRQWGPNGRWDVNYCGLTKSTDGGQTYTRVDDVAFTGYKDTTVAALTGYEAAKVRDHYAPNFCQIWPVEHDGYIWIYGIQGGRFGGVKLARVLPQNIEDFDSYEFFTGTDEEGEPVFVAGKAGLRILNADDGGAGYVIEKPAGEMCVVWNEYLGKYMTIFQRNTRLVLLTSETPWGEWSEETVLLGYEQYNCMYCGFMNPRYMEKKGKVVYFIMSYWWDYESILMKLELY